MSRSIVKRLSSALRMREKSAAAAAEDLLELIMRSYARFGTLLTSNRLLHHGHVLKCGSPS